MTATASRSAAQRTGLDMTLAHRHHPAGENSAGRAHRARVGLDSHAALLVYPADTTAMTSVMAALIQPASSAHQREGIR